MQETNPENRRLGGLIGRFTRVSERKKITLNKRFLIFFFFLLLSILFWFLTALNKEYVTSISYPVRYIRFPEDRVLVNDIPDRLDLTVANFWSHDVSVLLNEGDGTYAPAVSYWVGMNPHSAALGDLNGDERPDLVERLDHLLAAWLHDQSAKPYAIPDPMQVVLKERRAGND